MNNNFRNLELGGTTLHGLDMEEIYIVHYNRINQSHRVMIMMWAYVDVEIMLPRLCLQI
jgi:hypothetical protein